MEALGASLAMHLLASKYDQDATTTYPIKHSGTMPKFHKTKVHFNFMSGLHKP